ncbi:Kinesin-like protein KIN-14S [Linum perenne]
MGGISFYQNLKNDYAILNEEYEHLKKKFVQESTERKRLYNEVIELKGNIRVFCRCRPINQAELEKGSNNVVEFDSSQDNELHILSTDSSKKQFKFDHVFKPDDNQEAVFSQAKPIVTSVLDAAMLDIKQAADGTQQVPGLIESHVSSTEEVWKLLQSGNYIRFVGSTSANEQSSRSHCLLRVTVKGESLIEGEKTRSHLWLVDLAGSQIEVEGERLKESHFINKSLSALGNVISALASKTSHIQYTNSKLTHMLQSSLGGDCKTLMFVQISPSSSDLGQTLCSLNFATRVRGIKNGPARKHADLNEHSHGTTIIAFKIPSQNIVVMAADGRCSQDNINKENQVSVEGFTVLYDNAIKILRLHSSVFAGIAAPKNLVDKLFTKWEVVADLIANAGDYQQITDKMASEFQECCKAWVGRIPPFNCILVSVIQGVARISHLHVDVFPEGPHAQFEEFSDECVCIGSGAFNAKAEMRDKMMKDDIGFDNLTPVKAVEMAFRSVYTAALYDRHTGGDFLAFVIQKDGIQQYESSAEKMHEHVGQPGFKIQKPLFKLDRVQKSEEKIISFIDTCRCSP